MTPRWPELLLISALALALATTGGWIGSDWASTHAQVYGAPSFAHPLGTNALGQDLLARLLQGLAQLGLSVLPGALLAIAVGVGLGLLAAWRRDSWLDRSILSLADVFDSLPSYLMMVALAVVVRAIPGGSFLLLAALFWTSVARSVRAEAVLLMPQAFVEAALALGLTPIRVVAAQLLPILQPVLAAQALITLGDCLKAQVVLGFLGLDAQAGASLGSLIAEGTADLLASKFQTLLVGSAPVLLLMLALDALSRRIRPQVL